MIYKLFKKYTIFIVLVLLMVIGYVFRTYYLDQNNIVFGYDQARDAYIASQITQGDLKILGPPVSLGGFYHGVLYYYFISLPYFLSQGDPKLPIIFISLLNIIAIPMVYLIGKNLFNKKIGLLSAIFYTVSFDIIQYSNWLSNPSLAVPFSVLFFYGLSLYLYSTKKNIGAFLTALGYGLCFQSQFFLGYLIIPIIFSIFYFKTPPNKKQFFIFSLTTILVLSTMILSYIKFGFTFIDGFKNMLGGKNYFDLASYDFISTAKLVLVRMVENFSRVVLPFNSFYAFLFVLSCFILLIQRKYKKPRLYNSLDLLWIFVISQILILPFGGNSTAHINVGLQLPVIIISAASIIEFTKNKKYLFLALILFILTTTILINFKTNPRGSLIFAIQKPLTLKNEIETIDYTYQSSQGHPFSINTITSPYWVNTLWSYVYQYYGQDKYKYLPSFHGRDQTGQLSYLSQNVNSQTIYYYLIIEPDNGIPRYLIDDSIAYEDSFSKKIEERTFNGIVVQKRELIKPFNDITFVK